MDHRRQGELQLYERGVPAPQYRAAFKCGTNVWRNGSRLDKIRVHGKDLNELMSRIRSQYCWARTDSNDLFVEVSEDFGKTWRHIEHPTLPPYTSP